jgi:hypothetical protein
MAVVEDRSCARIDVEAALRAHKGAARSDLMVCRIFAALSADVPQPVADIHDSRQASSLGNSAKNFLTEKAWTELGFCPTWLGDFACVPF